MRTGGTRRHRFMDVSTVPVFPLPVPVRVSTPEHLEIIDFAGGSRSSEAGQESASGLRGPWLTARRPGMARTARPESLDDYGRCVNTSREKSDA